MLQAPHMGRLSAETDSVQPQEIHNPTKSGFIVLVTIEFCKNTIIHPSDGDKTQDPDSKRGMF